MDLNQCPCSGKNLERFLRPTVMALLAREGTHGYDIVQQLSGLQMYGDSPPDASGVYKILKAMEREGLVSSTWNLSDSAHAKRKYVLSKKGTTCLKHWIETLEAYHLQIDGVLAVLKSGDISSPVSGAESCSGAAATERVESNSPQKQGC
jgi:DNA-binding PadR family transcriptional regulator